MYKNRCTHFSDIPIFKLQMVADALLITVLLSIPTTLTCISVHFYYMLGLNKEEIHVRA
jgi:hypothetical protein